MNERPKISIIINCFNGEKYLRETLETVLEQDFPNWELIFWDNQSSDKTAEIVKSFNEDRFRYFYADEHTSLGEARNCAMREIRGEFFSFLDSDDLWSKNRLSECLKKFNSSNGVGLVYSNCSLLFSDGSEKIVLKSSMQQGNVFESQLESFTINIGSAMIKKECLNKLDYWFDSRFSMIEDFDFFIRLVEKTKVAYTNKVLFKWRIHPQSLTWRKYHLIEKEHEIFLREFLEKHPGMHEKFCIKRLEARLAYHRFINNWNKLGFPARKLIVPYLMVDKRLVAIFLLSFLGLDLFQKVLRFAGKMP